MMAVTAEGSSVLWAMRLLGTVANWILGFPVGRGLCTQVVTGGSQPSETPSELKPPSFSRPETRLEDEVWL